MIYNQFTEDYHRPPVLSGEYKCAVWTGKEYDTFRFTSEHKPHTKAVIEDAKEVIRNIYGTVERIVCVVPA